MTPGFQPDMAIMTPEVPADHPVGIFNAEHRVILKNLDDLQGILVKLVKARGYDELGDDTKRLGEISHLLLEAESHHRREEEVLFPRMEREGITGPPHVMRLEHVELRARKRSLAEIAKQAGQMDFREWALGVQEAAGFIVANLRMHIYKEDNILYPKALDTLKEEEWGDIKQEFDRVGYCPFTPGR